MKTLLSFFFMMLLTTTVSAKEYPVAGYENYTINTSLQQNTISVNVPANLGDSVKLTAYWMKWGAPEYSNWYFNGNLLAFTGVGSITVTISSYGVYTIPFTLATITLTITPVNATGIDAISSISSFNINPTIISSDLHIELALASSEQVEIKMYSSSGRFIKSLWTGNISGEFKLEENVEMMAAGIYFITVSAGNSLLTRKIIKM